MDLAALQAQRWQPWLDWAAAELGARLGVGVGVTPVLQEEESLAALRQRVENYDDWNLTALQSLAPCLGSLVLALAVVEEALSAEEAFELSRLDEKFQNRLWGSDDEAKARTAGLRAEVLAAARMLELIKAG
jgi:chaperone required for assembly of F1-ATPase